MKRIRFVDQENEEEMNKNQQLPTLRSTEWDHKRNIL
jgi:hypothetical protein